ncbi:MAG: PEP-CTERM sorting domain-containing protein [Betaproteobacteria bacterium]|nr:PEP-CTERM sorting domain-containing protein [Betaproteobacteria bacterium]
MKAKTSNLFRAGIVGLLGLCPPAHAALTGDLGDIGSSLTITFDDFDGLTGIGPTRVGASVSQDVLFSASLPSTLGAFIADLGSNGLWGAGKVFAATGSPDTTGFGLLHYTFSDKVSQAAGAVLSSFDGGPVLLIAYGADTTILEAHVVDIATPGGFNEGSFFGITRPNADIRAIAFGGTGLVMDDFTFATPVPEPGTYALMLAGLGLVGTIAARKRRG